MPRDCSVDGIGCVLRLANKLFRQIRSFQLRTAAPSRIVRRGYWLCSTPRLSACTQGDDKLIASIRKKLGRITQERFLLAMQMLFAGALLYSMIQSSIVAGSFPPKPPSETLEILIVYSISAWCVLALVAGIAIFFRRNWGWWIELVVVLPFPVLFFIYWREVIPFTLETFSDYKSVAEAVALSAGSLYLPFHVARRLRQPVQSTSE